MGEQLRVNLVPRCQEWIFDGVRRTRLVRVFDNGVAGKTADEIQSMAVWQVKQLDIAVLLSHDWNANTLIAFPGAVKQLQDAGYVFLPLYPESVTMGENTKIKFS